jgi:putative ABC transport system substrate-binding protein
MTRRSFAAGIIGLAGFPAVARAQNALPVIGLLMVGFSASSADLPEMVALRDALYKGLAKQNYIPDQNVRLEYVFTGDDVASAPKLVTELVERKVAVIIAPFSTIGALAAKGATTSVPIVFSSGNDPVKAGIVTSMNRPGTNITGIVYFTGELGQKRFGALRQLLPNARRLAIIGDMIRPDNMAAAKEIEATAVPLGLETQIFSASNSEEIDASFRELAERGSEAILLIPNPLFAVSHHQLIGLAARYRIPAIYTSREFVDDGGLMSYGANLLRISSELGVYAGRILKGENPANMPVEQPTVLELAINLKTAKALGIEIPPTLLAIADVVIE